MPRNQLTETARPPRTPSSRGTTPVTSQTTSLRTGSPAGAVAFVLAALILLAGCSGVSAPTPLIAESMPTATPTPSPAPISLLTPEPERCAGGRLRVGDLAAIGDAWGAGVQSAIETARAWRPDAVLVTMQIGCAPLESAFRWEGTFYSEVAQSFFYRDTRLTEPAEIDPAAVPVLPIDEVNFREFHFALARAGYEEHDELNPATGAIVRLNAPTDPFGPPDMPQGLVYYVGVVGQGTVEDVFLSSPEWKIYPY